jgi:hypothetical protein
VVHVAHLFILQFYASSFGAGQWGEMAHHFSQCGKYKEAFHELGFQDIAEFDCDWCSVFFLLRGKKERNGQGAFSPGWTCPTDCAMPEFSRQILFKDQSMNFMCP